MIPNAFFTAKGSTRHVRPANVLPPLMLMLLVTLCSLPVSGQAVLTIQEPIKKFIVGKTITITTATTDELEKTLTESYRILLNGSELKNVITGKVGDDKRSWRISIPNKSELIGSGREMLVVLGNSAIAKIPIEGFYAEKPEIIRIEPQILYKDLAAAQEVTVQVKNYAHITKIEITSGDILFEASNMKVADASQFIIDENLNKILLKVKVGGAATELKLRCYYVDENFTEKATDEIVCETKMGERYNQFTTFKIASGTPLYTDDFTPTTVQQLFFDFTGVAAGKYKIESTDGAKISYPLGSEVTIPGSGPVNHMTFYLQEPVSAKMYKVIMTPSNGSANKLIGEFRIHPEPVPTSARIYGEPDLKIERILGAKHTIVVEGERIHDVPKIEVQLVDRSGTATLLTRSQRFAENQIMAEFEFKDGAFKVGQYEVQLVRGKDNKVYRIKNSSIDIVHPKKIDVEQTINIELHNPRPAPVPDRMDDELTGRILRDDSQIILKINPSKKVESHGPQFLSVTAAYYTNKGEVIKATMKDDGKTYAEISDTEKYWNLKEEFGITKLKVNERIVVRAKHAIEEYKSALNSPSSEFTYFSHLSVSDRLGITVSLPPYLVAARRVRRKTVTTNESGEVTGVAYDGDKELQFQPLTLNAGVGIKYRFKQTDYEDSRFGLGLYFLGLDFVNNKTRSEQMNDPSNHDFVERGSFNFMLLGEFSFLNLDNPNLRIPAYFGVANILNPIDDGPPIAFTFGLGIDIRLVGKN